MTPSLAERIKSDILTCTFLPGERLATAELQKRYAVGLNPLREALSRLCLTGLIQSQEQKGFRVAPVSKEDLLDLTRTRIMIECEALKLSIEHGDGEWEGNIVSAHHRWCLAIKARTDENADHIRELHTNFHKSLVAACGSQWLLHFRDILWDQSSRYRRLSMQKRSEREIVKEHDALVSATLARDVEKAVAQLTKHLSKTKNSVLDALEDGFETPKKTRSRP